MSKIYTAENVVERFKLKNRLGFDFVNVISTDYDYTRGQNNYITQEN